MRRAEIFEKLGDRSSAYDCYCQALTLDSAHRLALEGKARMALTLDNAEAAIEALKESKSTGHDQFMDE